MALYPRRTVGSLFLLVHCAFSTKDIPQTSTPGQEKQSYPMEDIEVEYRHRVQKQADDYDVWLTGYEPNVIDGQPAEPPCEIFPVTDKFPTSTAKATKTAQPVTAKWAGQPDHRLGPSVPSGMLPSINHQTIYCWIKGRPAVCRYHSGKQFISGRGQGSLIPLWQGSGFFPALRKLARFPTGRVFLNYNAVPSDPTNWLVSPKTRTRLGHHLRNGASPKRGQLHAQRGISSSESSEEYRR